MTLHYAFDHLPAREDIKSIDTYHEFYCEINHCRIITKNYFLTQYVSNSNIPDEFALNFFSTDGYEYTLAVGENNIMAYLKKLFPNDIKSDKLIDNLSYTIIGFKITRLITHDDTIYTIADWNTCDVHNIYATASKGDKIIPAPILTWFFLYKNSGEYTVSEELLEFIEEYMAPDRIYIYDQNHPYIEYHPYEEPPEWSATDSETDEEHSEDHNEQILYAYRLKDLKPDNIVPIATNFDIENKLDWFSLFSGCLYRNHIVSKNGYSKCHYSLREMLECVNITDDNKVILQKDLDIDCETINKDLLLEMWE